MFKTTPAPGAHIKAMLSDMEEVYMDPPSADAGETAIRYHCDLHKLIGVAYALIAALEIRAQTADASTEE